MAKADGSIIIDTKLDTSGLQRGTDNVNKQLDGVVQKVHTAAQNINEKINTAVKGVDTSKVSTGLTQSFDADSQKIRKILDDTSKSAKAKAAAIAGVYRKQGMSQSDAMKSAWEKIERSSEKGSEKVKGDMREITETAKKSGKKLGSSVGGGVQSFMSNISASFGKLGAMLGGAGALVTLARFGKDASDAARQLSDALTGLQSIVEGQGRSFAEAQSFIDEYTKDGLIPATNAITAYKNLASRGYDDAQIQQTMIALKDASAFGRQAALSMGDAVQSATEGLKNENSVLVDNAGVTKNVAKMWDEYAASIGTTANNLTQQQKIQAEVAGIMQETRFQTGDAAKVANTLSGQLQQLSFNFNNLKVAVGGIINPIVQHVLPVINTAIAAFTKLANAAAQVVSLIFGKVSTSSGGLAEQNNNVASSAIAGAEAEEKLASATEKAGKAAKKSLAGFDELNILQEKTAGGGGSGGAASGGVSSSGVSSPKVEVSAEIEDTVSPKLQAIANRFMEILEPLKSIDFKPATKSLKTLGYSFKNLGSVISTALEVAWKDILVPLSKWTIEEAAPPLVEMLASAFDLVAEATRPVIDGIQAVIEYLNPMVRFIGDTVILVINKFKEAFQELAKVFQDKAPKLTQAISNVGEMFGIIWQKIEPICKMLRELWDRTISVLISVTASGVGLMIDNFHGLTEFLAGAFTGDWSRAWKGIQGIFAGVADAIGKNAAALERATGIPFTNILENARDKFTKVRDVIKSTWNEAMSALSGGATVDFSIIGTNLKDAFAKGINKLIAGLNDALYKIIYKINDIILDVRAIHFEILGKTHYPFFEMPMIPQFAIPYLAKGAVIPPNAPFMGILGDQRHGTNVEAPLSTIQEAVALVMEDMTGGMMAGFEATVAVLREILEALLGIEIGDTVIAEAVERYNRKMAVVKGG